jgi:hypothetical protein
MPSRSRSHGLPGYVRIAIVLVAGGVGVIIPGFKDVIIALIKVLSGLQPSPEVPYWVGLVLVGTGVLVLAGGAFGGALISRLVPGRLGFKVKYSSGSKRLHKLRTGTTVQLGRAQENDMIIDDEYVSRHHCLITVSDDYVVVRDLDSHNPTKINGVKGRSGVVAVNEALIVGRTELTLVRLT